MSGILNENGILLGASFANQSDAIRQAGNLLASAGYVTEKYVDYMLEREQVTSTFMGNNLAIPHGINGSEAEILRSGIAVIQVPEGVSFGEDKTAYVVVGIAGKDGAHLDILTQIALACMEEDNIHRLRYAKQKHEVLSVLGF
ncbi:PTS sugar transporter subunit IIA [Paramixta manurensis]|uniref:PTS sugar transporter subunit IIA n=1 Tax=Paramixta manurensis TaxID=2740817 RepID=A0A6M8UEG1_9GAMM|nr:PTS sugar transporter subunit IIA [Erwiniaceae bacterium PD-1]